MRHAPLFQHAAENTTSPERERIAYAEQYLKLNHSFKSKGPGFLSGSTDQTCSTPREISHVQHVVFLSERAHVCGTFPRENSAWRFQGRNQKRLLRGRV